MDLISEIVATIAFGWSVTCLGMKRSLVAVTCLAFAALPVELLLLAKVTAAAVLADTTLLMSLSFCDSRLILASQNMHRPAIKRRRYPHNQAGTTAERL